MATPGAGFPVTPHSAQSSRRSSRRSWFDTPPTTKLEIAVEKPALKPPQGKNKRRSIDEIETLVLTHFTKPPRIGFGKIILGRSKTRLLMVQNPNDYEQEVVVERFPFKKCFNIDQTSFTVGPGDVASLTLTWTPQEAGNCREMILFHVNDVYRLQAYVFGAADDPKPPKKVRKGMLGARKAKQPPNPLCVVQTPALNTIRDSYSPRRSEETRTLRAQLLENQARQANQENIQPLEPEEIPQTPPPLESTAICKNDELFQQNTIERRKSGFSSPTLSTMSPIPITADNTNGVIIESYFCPGTDQTHLSSERKGSTESERGPLKSVSVEDNNKILSLRKSQEHAVQRKKSVGQENLQSVKGEAVQASPQRKKIIFGDGKQCVSPNTFLNDSRCTKKPSTPEVGRIGPSGQVSKVREVGATSPNSFLEDLTNGRNTLKVDDRKALSPSAVLNASIPHDLMLRQLETVRTSLHEGSFHAEVVTQTATVVKGKTTATRKGAKPLHTKQEKTTRNVFAYARSTDATNSKKKEKFLQRKIEERARFAKIADVPSPRRKTFLVKKKQTKVSPTRGIAASSRIRKEASPKAGRSRKAAAGNKKTNSAVGLSTKADANGPTSKDGAEEAAKTAENVEKLSSAQEKEIVDADNAMKKKRRSQWASPAVVGFIPPIVAANPDSPVSVDRAASGRDLGTPQPVSSPQVSTVTKQGSDISQPPQAESVSVSEATKKFETDFSASDKKQPAVCAEGDSEIPEGSGRLSAGRKLFPDVVSNESFNESSFKPLFAGTSRTVTKERPSVSPHTSGTANSSGRKLFPDLGERTAELDRVAAGESASPYETDSKTGHRSSTITKDSDRRNLGVSGGRHSPAHFILFGSPQKLVTSPSAEETRRATLTVTKSQPSQALLDVNSSKRDSPSHGDRSEDLPKVQEQRMAEEEEDVWETETIVIEQKNSRITSVSFQRVYQTPSELPSSPKSENSRRSTHAVRNPVILSKEGLVRKNLFAPFLETSSTQNAGLSDESIIVHGPGGDEERMRETAAAVSNKSQTAFPAGDCQSPNVFTDRVEHHMTAQRPTFSRGTLFAADGALTVTGRQAIDVSVCSQEVSSNSPRMQSAAVGAQGDVSPGSLELSTDFQRSQSAAVGAAVDVSAGSQEMSTDSLEPEGRVHASSGDGNHVRNVPENSCRSVDDSQRDSLEPEPELAESLDENVISTPEDAKDEEKCTDRRQSQGEDSDATTSTVTTVTDQTSNGLNTSFCQSEDGLSVSGSSSSVDPPREKMTEAKPILSHAIVKESLLKLKEAETSSTRVADLSGDADVRKESSSVSVTAETKPLPAAEAPQLVASHQNTKTSVAFTVMEEKRPKLRRAVSTEITPRAKQAVPSLQRATSQGLLGKTGASRTQTVPPRSTSKTSLRDGSKTGSQREAFNVNGKRLSPDAPKGEPRHKRVELDAAASRKGVCRPPLATPNTGKGAKAVRGVAQSKLILVKKPKTALPKHPLPFAAKNMYYDERWQDKQERGFVHWLNFVLTPSDEYALATTKKKVDARSIAFDGPANRVAPRLAPTKEVLSFRAYAARRRLNHLRRASCRLFQSEEVVRVVCRIEVEVENRRLAVRTDRMIHADIGIKQRILDMLLSYNPLWLRIGLETVYGEILQLHSNSDVIGLSRFILTRLLSSPDIAAQYAHPTVPHLYQDGYADAVAQHTLKKFLLLVYFLDCAKRSRLITHDPCLFCKDSEVKSTKEVLVQFSRDYLSGEGDVTKHLAYLGYVVSHVQTPLDEFDYAVTNLCTDLRDGVRLGRIVMLLSGDWGMAPSLRAPAISRLQKIHNVEVVLKRLTDRGLDLSTKKGGMVNARDIVDGHREKTLAFLWKLIPHFQTVASLNEAELQEEVDMLERTLRVKLCMQRLLMHPHGHLTEGQARRDSGAPGVQMENPMLQLLLKWSRLVCLHYGVRVENFTVSFSDGRALCCLVHHYHPALFPLDKVRFQTTQSYQEAAEAAEEGMLDGEADLSEDFGPSPFGGEMDPDMFEKLLVNERENFKTLYEKVSELGGIPLMLKAADMSNTIPDERVVITYVSYMCARLLDLRQETRAARIIQLAWRRFRLRRSARERRRKISACITIQRAVRTYLARVQAEREQAAAVRIQAAWRGHLGRMRAAILRQGQMNQQLHEAATTLQTNIRCCLTRREFLQKKAAAITIQSWVRGHQAQQSFEMQRQACLIIQSYFRSYQKMVAARAQFISQKHSAAVLQRAFRKRQERVARQRNRAACVLQAAWRRVRCCRDFAEKKRAVVQLQSWWKMVQARRHFRRMKFSAITIQRQLRATRLGAQARAEFLQAKSSAITVQKIFRGHQQRSKYLTQRASAVLIQKNFRKYKCRVKFRALRLAATVVQQAVRAHQARNKARQEFLRTRNACIMIQTWYHWQKQRQAAKKEAAAVKIQSFLRSLSARRQLQALRLAAQRESAATKLQAFVRGSMAQRKYQKLLHSVLLLQTQTRGCQARQRCMEMREALNLLADYTQTQERFQVVVAELHQRWSAVVRLQAWWRGCCQRMAFLETRAAAVKIQAAVRGHSQRKHFLKMLKSAVIIQRQFRAARKVRAAVKVQSWWRMYKQKKHFQATRRSVVRLQAWARKLIAVNRYRQLQQAAVTLQCRYRAQRLARSVRLQYQLTLGAAVVFQSAWKMHVVRKCYLRLRGHVIKAQAHCRRYLAVKHYQEKRRAAVCIQQHYRATAIGRQTREQFQATKQAVVRLQAFVRGRQQRKSYLEARKSCIRIQAAVRGWLTLRGYQRQYVAMVYMQRKWRSKLACQRAQNEYQASRRAVVRLQAFVRGYQQRRHYLETRGSCVKIQAAVRGWLALRSYQHKYVAIVYMQRKWRSKLACRRAQEEYHRRRQAVIRLQALIRCCLQRRRYLIVREACIKIQSAVKMWRALQYFQAQKQAAVTLQRRWRAVRSGREVRDQCASMQKAVVKIQALTRGYIARRHLSQLHQAATTIQTTYRCWQVRQRFLQQRSAALTLQRQFRAFQLGRQQQKEYAAIRKASVIIQAHYRGHAARLLYHETRQSVVRLQAAVRGYQQRRRFQTLCTAAVICQRRYRAKCLGEVFRTAFLLIREATVMIQKHARGYIARQRYQEQRSAAKILQAHTRGWLCRRENLKRMQAACVLQKHVRAWLAGKTARESFLKTQKAAAVLQRAWRCHRQKTVDKRNHAALVIQIHFRRFTAQQRYHHHLTRILRLQALARGLICRREHKAKKLAALKIQTRWRETLAARACRRTFLLQLGGAVVIQAAFRGYRVRGYYLLAVKRVVFLQAVFRGYLQKRRYQKLRETVSLLQRRVRGNALAQRQRHSYLEMRSSAVCIQRAYRRYQERQHLKKVQAVTCLQSHVRRILVQREYMHKRAAAVTLQAAIRTHHARRKFLQKRSAIVTIQTQVRWYLMVRQLREKVHRRRKAAAIIQRSYRRHYAHKRWCRLVRLRESICRTQAAVRLQRERRQQRAEFLRQFAAVARKQLAVVRIQQWYRRLLLFRQAQERLHHIIKLQSWVRMFLQRRRFLRAQEEAQALQKRREAAACVIQAAVRRWRVRQAEKRREGLITKVQAVWRGRRLRRSLNNKKIAAARKRVHEANKAATEEKKLGNRTSSALDFLLHYKQLAYILDALMHLDVATRLSAVCCERLVEVNAVGVIFRLIQSCNRSLPHMELIKYSISILLNLAKYEKTTPAVYEVDNSVSTLVELMTIYREKGGAIFTKTCMLLAILGFDAERREAMCADKRFVEKLQSIHALALRKHRMQVARARQAARSSLNATLPSRLHGPRPVKVRPAWVLRRDSLHEIEDPMAALSFLLDTLHIGPKH
ncbi:hypothetical protein BaRGS_00004345 [Batillaria attramentaria]|uniref:Calponin-homology (CH) domain-containing protein n=1 Tax=Batillaria attramentaria TaxID=370345 RepID=A0ABD0LYF4_9CAEN